VDGLDVTGHGVGMDDGHRVTGFTGRDHRARRPIARIGAVIGAAAVIIAAAVGTVMLTRPPSPPAATSPTAEHITVSSEPPIPLSGDQIAGLLDRVPDYGLLADPQRRASCLSGLGYPASVPILGAQPVHMGDRPGVLLVLGGTSPKDLVVLVVPPSCSSIDTGLIADTQIARP
jgi:hypothetical protein